MTTAEILAIVEQFIGQADAILGGEHGDYTDPFILDHLKTVNFMLKSSGIDTGVAVDPVAETITPAPTDKLGLLLAVKTATVIIKGDLIKKVRLGELGVSFKTGATSITTSDAAKRLTDFSDFLMRKSEMLETMFLSEDPNTVILRHS